MIDIVDLKKEFKKGNLQIVIKRKRTLVNVGENGQVMSVREAYIENDIGECIMIPEDAWRFEE